MRISELYINNYYQFKKLELNLTYPKGHDKAGQPLDKVCFIGQSGTGKTTLLKILMEFVFPDYFSSFAFLRMNMDSALAQKNVQLPSYESSIRGTVHYDRIEYSSIIMPGSLSDSKTGEKELLTNKGFGSIRVDGVTLNNEEQNKNQFIADIIRRLGTQTIFGIYIPEGYKHYNNPAQTISEFLDLRYYDVKNLWTDLKNEINDYNDELVFRANQLYDEAKNEISDNRDRKFEELKRWETQNPNPLKRIAENILDDILAPLKLKVHQKITRGVIKGEYQIPLQNIETGDVIDFDFLSSGTQNIIYPSLLLYRYKPENAMMLFDEVENSLYPNIQQIIIDHYIRLAPKNQFFFATHSPIIASSFDPWEIVELKFDDSGYVIQEKYYEGERDIKNYKLNPKFLRWDKILTKIFDLDNEGNPERSAHLLELSKLDKEIDLLKGKKDKEVDREELINRYIALAKLLEWATL